MSPEQIENKLKEKYVDSDITVSDLTGTQDHYQVEITSNSFSGLTRIKQHQHVMDTFSTELKSGEIHALSIKTRTQPL